MDKEIRIIKNHVARFRQIESAADCLFAGLKIGSYVGIALLVWLGVDNWLHLRMEWRIIGFLSVLAGCAPFTIHLIKDLKKTLYQDNLALRLEFHNQHQENWLVNSMDFAKRPSLNPSGIAAELIRLTAANIHQFRLTSRIEWRNVKPVLLPFLSIIGTLVIYVLIAPEYFTNGAARLFFPLGSIPPKTRVVLEGDFESRSVLFGQDHPLRFILKKGRPYLKGRVIFREEDSDVVREEILLPSPEKTYSYVFKSLRNNLHWKVNLGDYQSPWIPLNVILPPKIRSEEIRVRYPSYLSQKEMVDNTWTSVSHFPAGSVLSLQIELTSPIQCLEWVDTLSMQSHEFNKISDSTWQTELKLDRSLSFRLKYTDMDSRSGRFLKEYSFNAILDMP
ncbi:MAG: hypothetical protein JW774_13690, partial [Candidatus Aureabacteria bacterium]|nr:hypothetical protein [Candidatus Auribacterota bacterium]